MPAKQGDHIGRQEANEHKRGAGKRPQRGSTPAVTGSKVAGRTRHELRLASAAVLTFGVTIAAALGPVLPPNAATTAQGTGSTALGAAVAAATIVLHDATPLPPAVFGAKVLGPVRTVGSGEPPGLLPAPGPPGPECPCQCCVNTWEPLIPPFPDRRGTVRGPVRPSAGSGCSARPIPAVRGPLGRALSGNHLAQTVSGGTSRVEAAFGTPLDRVRRRQRRSGGRSTAAPGCRPGWPATWPSWAASNPGSPRPTTWSAGLLRKKRYQVPTTGRLPRPLGAGNTVAAWRATTSSTAARATVSGDNTRIGAAAQTATCGGIADAGLTPSELTAAYGFAGFYDHGDEGQGETIGLIEYAVGDAAAVATYQGCEKTALTIYYDDASWVPVGDTRPRPFGPLWGTILRWPLTSRSSPLWYPRPGSLSTSPTNWAPVWRHGSWRCRGRLMVACPT